MCGPRPTRQGSRAGQRWPNLAGSRIGTLPVLAIPDVPATSRTPVTSSGRMTVARSGHVVINLFVHNRIPRRTTMKPLVVHMDVPSLVHSFTLTLTLTGPHRRPQEGTPAPEVHVPARLPFPEGDGPHLGTEVLERCCN